MVPKLFLSDQTYLYRSEYDILQVWLNIIDPNMCIKGVEVDIFFSGKLCRCRWFCSGRVSGDGLIYLWCLNNGTLIIINH
jgi:hypothetical protein